MPRLRLAARILRARSSSSAATSCPSCAAAVATTETAAGPSSSSPSSFPLNPSPTSSFWKSTSSSSAPRRQDVDERFPRLLRTSSPIRDHRHDLIVGVKNQQQQVWLLGQNPPSPRRCLHTFSVVYSNDSTNYSERGLHDDQDSSRLENSYLVDPSLPKCEEKEDETDVIVVGEEDFYDRHDSTLAASAGYTRRLTAVLLDEGEEEEVTAQVDSSLLTSTSEDDESDLSALEIGVVESQPEDLDDDEFEEGENRQWTGSSLEDMPHEASAEREDVSSSELFSDFLDVVSITAEDARELGLVESEPQDGDQQHSDGLPYLHTLSVDEVQEILEKARAKDVRILHVRKCCEWVDQLVFASGRSSRHLRGMADAIVYKVKQRSENVGPNSFPIVEGRDGEQWMAIDCGNIVVHLFLEEARSYYNLEEFWAKKSNPRLVETY